MAETEWYVAADGAVMGRQVFEGGPCPDAPHNCQTLGCGRTESWPVLDGGKKAGVQMSATELGIDFGSVGDCADCGHPLRYHAYQTGSACLLGPCSVCADIAEAIEEAEGQSDA